MPLTNRSPTHRPDPPLTASGVAPLPPFDRFQYLLVLAACVAVTLPLEFAFGARVWRRPRRLAIAVAPVLAAFLLWDLWASRHGTWSFAPEYTIGLHLPGGLPIEELLFFVVVPACALLTYESIVNLQAGSAPVQEWMRRR